MKRETSAESDQVQKLRALCEQAEQLQKAAAKLCRQLEQQIERSRVAHDVRIERRRKPRHR